MFLLVLCLLQFATSREINVVSRDVTLTPSGINITELLSRTWTNQDGSTMDLGVYDEDFSRFSLAGIYVSGVGSAKGKYVLFGSGTSRKGVVVFGWQVVWNNGELDSYSLSSWSAYLNPNRKPLSFEAIWLLTQTGPSEWNSTTIGEDKFTSS